jgi:two-component system chemotaxis response regulator CheB
MTESTKPISVLIAEDSPTQREFLLSLLEEAGGFKVVGVATDGLKAIEETGRLRPDIVLMDCHMPRATGIEATRTIMERFPTPIVIVSSTLTREEIDQTFEAIKAGALAFLPKPTLAALEGEADADSDSLIRTLRLMADVKVVGRRVWPTRAAPPARLPAATGIRLIGVGGSTGAPGVIAEILGAITSAPTAPILIVQHMANGFVEGFARWLSGTTGIPVSVARHGMTPARGHAYLCPDNWHMGLNAGGRIDLSDGAPEEGFRPSANFLFRSMSQRCGPSSMGVLLTGMGRDGATGLLALRRAGGVTIVQDEASCVVFGMPKEAIAVGAAQHILPPNAIARVITEMSTPAGA